VTAEISEKQARSIKYQITIARLPLAKDIADFSFEGTPINPALVHDLRWSPSVGQFGDLDKLGPGCRQAANFSTSPPPYASSGVCPANALWGRLVL
jgi:hypothetical protein